MTRKMRRPLAVGDVIHGSARGAFGGDHHNCVKISNTGPSWIEASDARGGTVTAHGYRDLVLLMQVRDEDRCSWKGDCPTDQLVQLTESGGFFTDEGDVSEL